MFELLLVSIATMLAKEKTQTSANYPSTNYRLWSLQDRLFPALVVLTRSCAAMRTARARQEHAKPTELPYKEALGATGRRHPQKPYEVEFDTFT